MPVVGAALVVRLALNPVVGVHAPYLPFALAVMLAARIGGRGPGLVATALSTLGTEYFFIEPRNTFTIADPAAVGALALFVVVGALISLAVGHLRESMLASARAEETLRRQAQLIELSHDAVITAGADRVIRAWNAGAAEMYGFTEAEAIGSVIHNLLKTRGGIPIPEIDAVLQREGRWEGELIHTARDGRQIVSESRHVLLRDAGGRAAGILEINRDITERKRAEEAVRELSEQRGLALDTANMGAWDYRLETGEAFWDARCREIFGVPAEGPVRYEDALAHIHPEDRAAIEEAVRQARQGVNGGAYHREYRVVWPDGSVHSVSAHGRATFEGEGERRRAVRFAGVNMDISERRLAEERLRESQKMESIGMLAGGVAHDFNNLLTVIMGSANMTLEAYPTCEYPRAILAAAQRASYLTRQLLAYAGKGHVVVKVVDLTELVRKSAELLSASVPKRVSLSFQLAEGLPCLEADPSRLEQILMNLVINASEAIPLQTDGLIDIATRGCEVTPEMAQAHSRLYDVAAGPYVCLEVRDNGSGMDAATVARIFEPFFTTKFTGRGLGLAAVHGIARSSKGFIDVLSAPGSGTTFQVYLPASARTRAEEPAPVAAKPQVRGTSTVLVVDDEQMVRQLACAALRRHGYDVQEARNGKDALRLLAAASTLPAVALLDLAMPVMGGEELVPILEATYPGLKIILSSGFPEEEARKLSPSASLFGFLQKPYTVSALAEKVAEALREPATRATGPS